MTAHTFVATEAGPCVILATGNRREDHERVYRRSEAALRYDAGPEVELTDPERRGPGGPAAEALGRAPVG